MTLDHHFRTPSLHTVGFRADLIVNVNHYFPYRRIFNHPHLPVPFWVHRIRLQTLLLYNHFLIHYLPRHVLLPAR